MRLVPVFGVMLVLCSAHGQLSRISVEGNCLDVPTIPFTIREMHDRGPAFSWLVIDHPSNRVLDSVCTTSFPLADDPSTFIFYDLFTYHDGSTRVTSTIATDIDKGTTFKGTSDYTISQRFFSFLGGNTLIGCENQIYGAPTNHNVFAVTFGAPNRQLLRQVQQQINIYNLAPPGLYVLPYRYPPRCVTQQVCSLLNPLLRTPIGYKYSTTPFPQYTIP